MPKLKTYDVIVIGAGAAGLTVAEVARSQGASVCIVEKEKLGGECPNWACVPTKSLVRSAKMYNLAKFKLKDFGVHAYNVEFSFPAIIKRKDSVVSAVTGNGKRLEILMKEIGVPIFHGTAKFVDQNTLEVESQKITAKKIVIATGASSYIPPISGLKEAGYLTFKEVIELKHLPESIVIIGGGAVACEFATFFSLLGSKVTILQLGKQILPNEDEEIAQIVEVSLKRHGVNIYKNTKTLSVKNEGTKKRVAFQVGKKKRQSVLAGNILIATGKRANVEDLRLEKAKIKIDKFGYIKVSDSLQTSVPHIFSAGDVNGGMQFTHVAHHEGFVTGVNLGKRSSKTMMKTDNRVVPRVTFVDPEVASVGITAETAVKKKLNFGVASFPVGALGRSVTDGNREGVIKILFDKKTRKVLGGHIVAERAGEMIHEVALAMYSNLKIDDLGDMIHAFPTYSEGIGATAGSV